MPRTQLSPDDWAVLTPGEQAVAGLVAQGLRNAEVADELSLSVATVKTHLSRAFRKLGVSSRSQLAAGAAGARSGGDWGRGPGSHRDEPPGEEP